MVVVSKEYDRSTQFPPANGGAGRHPAVSRLAALALAVAACAPGSPCRTREFHQILGWSRPYAGTWVVGHGDTLTLPQLGDRFRLAAFTLDTDTINLEKECRLRG